MFFYIVLFFVLIYWFNRWRLYEKYYKQGLDGPRPLPLLGNSLNMMFKPFKDYEADNLKKYGSTYVDYIFDKKGVIITSNPEYVKKILIKDFHNFYFRLLPPYRHQYQRKAVIFTNEEWKRIRTQITPVFTSNRLKRMYKNFGHPIKTTLNNIDQLIDSKQADCIDVKNLMKSFALDMIGNVVFSLETNSFKNDDFAKKVKELFQVRPFLFLFSFIMPRWMMKFLKLTFLKEEVVNHFAKLALSLIEERKHNQDKVYNDFIEMLLKLETEEEIEKNIDEDGRVVKKLTKEEIVGQCLFFFIAGMETISTTLSLLLYELAVHPEIQDKLHKELVACHPDNEVPYDELNKSKYLDNVINETLRKHTTLNRVFRQALGDYDFGDFKIKKGQAFGISICNLHSDETVYSEPNRFKPERFEENPNGFGIYFMPFSEGPRNCIGNRFALIEMKSIAIQLIKNYRIFATDKTDIPLKVKNATLLNMVENVILGFEKRSEL